MNDSLQIVTLEDSLHGMTKKSLRAGVESVFIVSINEIIMESYHAHF